MGAGGGRPVSTPNVGQMGQQGADMSMDMFTPPAQPTQPTHQMGVGGATPIQPAPGGRDPALLQRWNEALTQSERPWDQGGREAYEQVMMPLPPGPAYEPERQRQQELQRQAISQGVIGHPTAAGPPNPSPGAPGAQADQAAQAASNFLGPANTQAGQPIGQRGVDWIGQMKRGWIQDGSYTVPGSGLGALQRRLLGRGGGGDAIQSAQLLGAESNQPLGRGRQPLPAYSQYQFPSQTQPMYNPYQNMPRQPPWQRPPTIPRGGWGSGAMNDFRSGNNIFSQRARAQAEADRRRQEVADRGGYAPRPFDPRRPSPGPPRMPGNDQMMMSSWRPNSGWTNAPGQFVGNVGGPQMPPGFPRQGAYAPPWGNPGNQGPYNQGPLGRPAGYGTPGAWFHGGTPGSQYSPYGRVYGPGDQTFSQQIGGRAGMGGNRAPNVSSRWNQAQMAFNQGGRGGFDYNQGQGRLQPFGQRGLAWQ